MTIQKLKLKCTECRKRATSFHETQPLCTDCFIVIRLKKHPRRLEIFKRRKFKK